MPVGHRLDSGAHARTPRPAHLVALATVLIFAVAAVVTLTRPDGTTQVAEASGQPVLPPSDPTPTVTPDGERTTPAPRRTSTPSAAETTTPAPSPTASKTPEPRRSASPAPKESPGLLDLLFPPS